MKRVWGYLLFVFILASLVMSAFVHAEIVVKTYPDKQISKGSPVVIVVDPDTTERPIRITWSVYDGGLTGIGSFPMVDGKGVCYFSEDGNATCGPSPFTETGETEIYVHVVTRQGATNKTKPLNITTMQLPMSGVKREGREVKIAMYMNEIDWIKYVVYNEDFTVYNPETALTYNTSPNFGYYGGIESLNPGVYYFVFQAKDNETYGSALKRIEIPSGDFLTVGASKNLYYIGENIVITGTTNADSVSGVLYDRNGDQVAEVKVDLVVDQKFSYNLTSKSDWLPGQYELRITEPATRTVDFVLQELFSLNPKAISGEVNTSGRFSDTITVQNLKDTPVNITLEMRGGVKSEYVKIGKNTLASKESTTLNITIPSVTADVTGGVVLKTDTGIDLEVPVEVKMKKAIQQCPPPVQCTGTGPQLDISPAMLYSECVPDEDIHFNIDEKNNGDASLGAGSFYYTVTNSPGSDNDFEGLDYIDGIEIPLTAFSLDAGETDSLSIKITPDYEGTYKGIIKLMSGNSSGSFYVDLNCFGDPTEYISAVRSSLPDNIPDDVKDDIERDLSKAETSLINKDYADAQEYLAKADAKLEIIDKIGTARGGGFDPLPVLIPVIIIVAVAGLLWYFKFRKSVLGEEEFGEEEEF